MAGSDFLTGVLTDVARALNEKGHGYALAGGLAYSVWMEPRATADIDFVLTFTGEGWGGVCKTLTPLFTSLLPHPGPMRIGNVSIWRAVGIREGREMVLDFIEVYPEYQQGLVARRIVVEFSGVDLPVVTPEDLLLLKAMSGRLQDQADVRKLALHYRRELDWGYIGRWAPRLGISSEVIARHAVP